MGLTERSGKKRTGKDETDLCRYREAEGIGVPGKQTAAALILHLLHKKGVSLSRVMLIEHLDRGQDQGN